MFLINIWKTYMRFYVRFVIVSWYIDGTHGVCNTFLVSCFPFCRPNINSPKSSMFRLLNEMNKKNKRGLFYLFIYFLWRRCTRVCIIVLVIVRSCTVKCVCMHGMSWVSRGILWPRSKNEVVNACYLWKRLSHKMVILTFIYILHPKVKCFTYLNIKFW